MGRPTLKGSCAYCGSHEQLTKDHVPPANLFGRPRPSNLITVPCCLPCNRHLAKDDEYFRIVITAGIDRERFPIENSESVEAIKNLARPQSRGFANEFARSYRGKGELLVDKLRVVRTVNRIAIGLYAHEMGTICAPNTVVTSYPADNSAALPTIVQTQLHELAGGFKTIGEGVFQYALRLFEDTYEFEGLCLTRFYSHRTFLSFLSRHGNPQTHIGISL
jgi:hypothetical protein